MGCDDDAAPPSIIGWSCFVGSVDEAADEDEEGAGFAPFGLGRTARDDIVVCVALGRRAWVG